MPLPIRAVLFDFDGTLADSYTAITASVNHVRRSYGLPDLSESAVRQLVGHGLLHLMQDVVPGVPLDEAADRYRQHHPSVMLSGTRPLPGVVDALRRLHQHGVKLGICSNKPSRFTRELVGHLGWNEYFSAILGPEDVSAPKPAPDMLWAALRQLGVEAADALYVGDMRVDVETGRAAGVRIWAVATGSDPHSALQAAQPDRLLTDMTQLVPWLDGDVPS